MNSMPSPDERLQSEWIVFPKEVAVQAVRPSTYLNESRARGAGCGGLVVAYFLSTGVVINLSRSLPGVPFSDYRVIALVVLWAVTMALGFVVPYKASLSGQRAEKQRRARTETQRALESAQLRENERARELGAQAESALVTARVSINRAEQARSEMAESLRRARNDFQERAYSPFWSHVEVALARLADMRDSYASLASSASKYRRSLAGRRHTFPKFPFTMSDLPKPDDLVAQLDETVRAAHKDFQFANIYENRQTRHAVVAGFGSMIAAIEGLRSEVWSGFTQLDSAIRETNASIELAAEQRTADNEDTQAALDSIVELLEED